jgi:hypothetical protein
VGKARKINAVNGSEKKSEAFFGIKGSKNMFLTQHFINALENTSGTQLEGHIRETLHFFSVRDLKTGESPAFFFPALQNSKEL